MLNAQYKIGDVIKAQDFNPACTGEEYYVEGKITFVSTMLEYYQLEVIKDSHGNRESVQVPMEGALMNEWVGRIVKK